jgi:hypothetical protein
VGTLQSYQGEFQCLIHAVWHVSSPGVQGEEEAVDEAKISVYGVLVTGLLNRKYLGSVQ